MKKTTSASTPSFLTKGILNLVAQGVITNRKKGINEGKLVASSAVGDRDLYDWLHDNPSIEFHPSDYVNNPAIIARHNKMVAMNVAMGIDLTGQVVADALPYNHFSGVSGLMDFTRGAMASPQGKSIIMLSSTTMDGRSQPHRAPVEEHPRWWCQGATCSTWSPSTAW